MEQRTVNTQLILLRGLPGSGKSTFAKLLLNMSREKIVHYEADMYFETNGGYHFDPTKLSDAHQWCLQATSNTLLAGVSVIVSNTFTRLMELQPYLNLAKRYNVPVTVLHVEGNHGSIHNVPEQTMRKMAARWESYQ
jgi:predicted kinase